MGNLALNFDVPDAVRAEAETVVSVHLNHVLAARIAHHSVYESALLAGDAVTALEEAKGLRLFDALYHEGLTLLRKLAEQAKEAVQC